MLGDFQDSSIPWLPLFSVGNSPISSGTLDVSSSEVLSNQCFHDSVLHLEGLTASCRPSISLQMRNQILQTDTKSSDFSLLTLHLIGTAQGEMRTLVLRSNFQPLCN